MSDLLPRQYEDFRKKEYWDSFFEKRSEEAFEWYGEYAQLQRALFAELGLPTGAPAAMLRKIKKAVRVLVVGCGNSELSKQLADDGFSTLVSIDFSERVVDEMRRKHSDMQWKVMDMTDMSEFASASFDLVVDKGALDALMASDTPEIRQDASKMLLEVQRVLSPGGRYCCVTMAQDFILRHVLTFFCVSAAVEPASGANVTQATGWAVSVREVPRDARKPFVPFLVTATKCQRGTASARKAIYNAKPFEQDSGAARQQWLTHEVEATQWYTMTQGGLKKLQVGRQEVIELIANNSSDATAPEADPVPRFTLRLVDVSMRGTNGTCAVFLIPQGREHEWMFATEEGAAELAGGAGFSRLILVALGRGHQFDSTTQVQEELNAKILELAPETLGSNEKIPYLTVEEGLGKRNIVHQGQSPLSGAYFIEEVDDAGDRLRRLVFLSNTNVIQSEVRLVVGGGTKNASGGGSSKKKKNKKKKNGSASASVVDTSYLAFDYHKGMIAALHAAWLGPRAQGDNAHRSLLIGLGGGCLAKYVHDNAPSVSMTACELDPTIVTVAEQFFGFQQDERMNVVVADGLAYVGERAASAKASPSNGELRVDSIIVDVDAKERSVGMSCPPVAFVEDKFLRDSHALLADGGVMLLNVSCRNSALFQQILARLKLAFEGASAFVLRPSEQDVNSVVFIRKEGPTKQGASSAAALKQLQEYGKRRGKAAASQDLPAYVDDELCELIREIQLC